jgi:hypothetical protein
MTMHPNAIADVRTVGLQENSNTVSDSSISTVWLGVADTHCVVRRGSKFDSLNRKGKLDGDEHRYLPETQHIWNSR